MSVMTFKTDLLPNTDLGQSLGSSTQRWNIYGNLTGNADTATKAEQDNNGNSITATYVKKSGDTMTGALTILGNAASNPLIIRGITGSDGNGAVGDLYLNYNGGRVYLSTSGTAYVDNGNYYGTFKGNADTATKATQDSAGNTITSKYVTVDTAQTISNHKTFYTPTSGNNAYADGSAIEIREAGLVTSNQTAWSYAPKIGFHWGAKYQGVLGLHSNGQFYFGLGGSTGNVQVNCGLITATAQSNTVTIGSQNTNYCHFSNSANRPFYFNKTTYIDGQLIQYDNAVTSMSWINGRDSAAVKVGKFNNYHAGLSMKTTNGSYEIGVYTGDNLWITYCPDAQYNANSNTNYKQVHMTSSGQWYGAVWNDYAEMRNVPEANTFEETEDSHNVKLAGRCVRDIGDDTMALSSDRMQPGCKIISDTFGFNIGETDNCKTPIAVSGRALVYIYEGREAARQHIGQPVCSGPDGTVSIMTDEEYRDKGYCCVGTISAIPEYQTWGSGNIQVDGRIWIYIK